MGIFKAILTILSYFLNPERYMHNQKRKRTKKIRDLEYQRRVALKNNDSEALTRIHNEFIKIRQEDNS